MRWVKFLLLTVSLILGLFLSSRIVSASEGTVELRSTTNEDYRCFAASLRMQDQNFRLLVSCRDLVYPVDTNIFSYTIWATPSDGGNAIKLGELGLGKVELRTKEAFTGLFVTTEQNSRTRTPSGNTVMTGSVSPLSFLDRPTTPTPTEEAEGQEIAGEAKELTTRQKLVLALRRAGLVIFLAFLSAIGLVFVLARSRR